MKVLVTGGNQGIGYALCKQLAVEHGCHVLLSARSAAKGKDAVSSIEAAIASSPGCGGSVDFLELDTSDDASVAAAAETYAAKQQQQQQPLGAIVNNAGIGLNTGSTGDILNTNLRGPKRVCDGFLPYLDAEKGRIVNVCSGSGPMYVGSVRSNDDRAFLCQGPTTTDASWEKIDAYGRENLNDSGDPYGLSKALLAVYTGVLARENPKLLVSAVTPGFIDTRMTAGWGASKTPDQGTAAIRKCLFEDLEHGSGWYYGSDGVRSPYHFMRNPGQPEYDGVNPFL